MHGLQQAAEGAPLRGSGSSGGSSADDAGNKDGSSWPVAALSQAEAGAVLQECDAAGMFWEALVYRGRRVAMASGARSFSAVATLASGRRLQLTWRRLENQLLPVEVAELPPLTGPPRGWAQHAKQQQQEEELPPPPPPPPPPPERVPPPLFNPKQAAMLLTGLAQLQLRVGGVVEPLLQQCQPALARQVQVNDVVGILVALGELQMEPGAARQALLAVLATQCCWELLQPS